MLFYLYTVEIENRGIGSRLAKIMIKRHAKQLFFPSSGLKNANANSTVVLGQEM
jgi:hypothetical protein